MLFITCCGMVMPIMPICCSHSPCGVAATVVLLPQPSPSSTKVIPPKPQTSPRHCHNSHRAVATTVTFIHNNPPVQCHNSHHDIATTPTVLYANTITVILLQWYITCHATVSITSTWCCHHPRHADTTTITMPLPQLSRCCC